MATIKRAVCDKPLPKVAYCSRLRFLQSLRQVVVVANTPKQIVGKMVFYMGWRVIFATPKSVL